MPTSINLGDGEPVGGGGGTTVGGGGTVGGDGGTVVGGATASSTPIIAPPVAAGGGIVTPQITVSTAPAILAAASSSAASTADKDTLKNAAVVLSHASAVQKASQTTSSGAKSVTIGSAAQVAPAATTAAPAAAILSASGATEAAVKSVTQGNLAVAAVAIAVEKSSSVNNTDKLKDTATVSDTITFSNKKYDADGGIIESDLNNSATFDTMKIEFDITGISYIGFIHSSDSGNITILSQPLNFQGVQVGTVFNLSYGATLTITDVVGAYIKGNLFAPFSNVTGIKIPEENITSGLPIIYEVGQASLSASHFILELGKVTEVSIKKNFDDQLAGGASQNGKNMANAAKLPGDKLMSALGAAGNTSNDIATLKPLSAEVLGGNLSATVKTPIDMYPVATVTVKAVSKTLSPAEAAGSLSFIEPGPATTSVFAAHFAKADGTLLVGSLADNTTWAPGGVEIKIPTPASGVLILNHISTSGVVTLLGTITNPEVGPYLFNYGTSFTISSISGTSIIGVYKGPFGNVTYTPGDAPVRCLVAGTRIVTPSGYVPVEKLATGDMIVTAAGKVVPIKMLTQNVPVTSTGTAPYVIKRGAFGSSPKADVTLSPLHAIQVRRGVWEIPKYAAERYPGVQQKAVGEPVTYYHVETPDYFRDNLLIEGGVVVESFAGPRIVAQMPAGAKLYRYSTKLGGFTRFSPTAAKSLK